MGPLEFEPILKSIRWGGTRLGTVLGKPIGDRTDVAESWEVADQRDGQSVVASGPHQGRTLEDLIAKSPQAILGAGARPRQFPLLIKFLDAHDRLSVQVHPNDEQAKAYGADQNGKTEAWVILDAAPGSRLFAGLKEHVDRARFEQALQDGTVAECLHALSVQAGDAVFIPAGTVHAIGEGVLLAEVQQQSNLTFRIDDWGRLGSDGQPRQLHIEDALRCIDFSRGPVAVARPRLVRDSPKLEELVTCEYFTIRRHTVAEQTTIDTRGQFRVLMTLAGEGTASAGGSSSRLQLGKTVLLPADCAACEIRATHPLTILEASGP